MILFKTGNFVVKHPQIPNLIYVIAMFCPSFLSDILSANAPFHFCSVVLQEMTLGVYFWMDPCVTYRSTLRFKVQLTRRRSGSKPNRTVKTASSLHPIGMVTSLFLSFVTIPTSATVLLLHSFLSCLYHPWSIFKTYHFSSLKWSRRVSCRSIQTYLLQIIQSLSYSLQ